VNAPKKKIEMKKAAKKAVGTTITKKQTKISPPVVPEAAAADEPMTQIEVISTAQSCQSSEQDQLHKQGQVFTVQTQDENQ